jgi:hypothetical protein
MKYFTVSVSHAEAWLLMMKLSEVSPAQGFEPEALSS